MGVAEWETQFKLEVDAALLYNTNVIKTAASAMLEDGIRPRTPYGDPSLWSYPAPANYTPGTARAGWEIEITPTYIRIYTDVPYAARLEYGWSSQAPSGMLRVSLLEWPKYLEQAKLELGFK